MGSFLRKLFLVTGVYCLGMGGLNLWLIQLTRPDLGERILVAGDSHVRFAIIPDSLGDCRNLGLPNEPLTVTRRKLEYLLERRAQPHTLVLGVGFHNFSDYHERKLQERGSATELFERIYAFTGFEGLEGVPFNRWLYYRLLARELISPKRNHHTYLGRYWDAAGRLDTTNDPERILRRHYYDGEKIAGISSHAERELQAIVDLTRSRNIRLVLLNTPLHEKYRRGVPRPFLDHHRRVMNSMRQGGVAVLDYHDLLLPDDYFYDYDHVNRYGARLLTRRVWEFLETAATGEES